MDRKTAGVGGAGEPGARGGETPGGPGSRAEADLKLLQGLVRGIAEATDVTGAMVNLLEQLCGATGWDYGEAWLPDPGGLRLRDTPVWHARHPHLHRFQAMTEGLALSKGEGLPGRVWASRRPEWLDDLGDERVFRRARAASETGLETGVGIPVLFGGKVVAVFAFFMSGRRARDDRAVELVRTALAPLGAVIELRRAEEAVRELNRELERRVDERTAALTHANAALRLEVAERKRAELGLRQLSRAVEQSPSAIIITDPAGNISYVNPAFTEITGFSSEEAIGGTPRIIRSGETPAAVYRSLWETISAGRVWHGEMINRRKDGSRFWELVSIAPVKDDDGRITHYAGIQTDITERKRVDDTLHRLYRITSDHGLDLPGKIQALLDLGCRHLELPIGTLTRIDGGRCEVAQVIDPDGIIAPGQGCRLDDSYCRVTVEDAEPTAVAHAQRDRWDQHPGYAAEQHQAYLGVRVVAGDQTYGVLGFAGREPHYQEFSTADREIIKILALWIGSEIARKAIEDRAREHQADLAHVARLATMGEMASGLAHELNQPLMAIASYSDACLRMLRSGAASPEKLEEVIAKTGKLALRGGEIIRRVRQMVTKQTTHTTAVRANDLVNEVLGFVASEINKRGVEVRLDLAPDLPAIAADPIQIEQVLLNIVRNALEAMAAGGEQKLSLGTRRRGADAIEIEVADAGPGLDPEAAARIFDTFYTSKPEGMGMGLSICRTIVEAHHGALRVESRPGAGTTIRVILPLPTAALE